MAAAVYRALPVAAAACAFAAAHDAVGPVVVIPAVVADDQEPAVAAGGAEGAVAQADEHDGLAKAEEPVAVEGVAESVEEGVVALVVALVVAGPPLVPSCAVDPVAPT